MSYKKDAQVWRWQCILICRNLKSLYHRSNNIAWNMPASPYHALIRDKMEHLLAAWMVPNGHYIYSCILRWKLLRVTSRFRRIWSRWRQTPNVIMIVTWLPDSLHFHQSPRSTIWGCCSSVAIDIVSDSRGVASVRRHSRSVLCEGPSTQGTNHNSTVRVWDEMWRGCNCHYLRPSMPPWLFICF